jgi:hypothetical protein
MLPLMRNVQTNKKGGKYTCVDFRCPSAALGEMTPVGGGGRLGRHRDANTKRPPVVCVAMGHGLEAGGACRFFLPALREPGVFVLFFKKICPKNMRICLECSPPPSPPALSVLVPPPHTHTHALSQKKPALRYRYTRSGRSIGRKVLLQRA